MRLSIQLYGQLRHMAGADVVPLEAPDGATLVEALAVLSAAYEPAFRAILFDATGALRPSLMLLVNEQSIARESPPALHEGDVVTVLPAISGG
jgi:molybdopterin converting factor small subunit